MNYLNTHEKGFRDLRKASKTVLSETEFKDIEKYCINQVLHRVEQPNDKFFISNMYLIALYKNLPKSKFEAIQFEWTDMLIRKYKDKIFAPSILETLVNYHSLFSGVEFNVESDGLGARVMMKDGCMYGLFCKETQNRICLRGKALQRTLNSNGSPPYFCVLERPPESHACIIRAKDALEGSDVLEEYRKLGKTVTVL